MVSPCRAPALPGETEAQRRRNPQPCARPPHFSLLPLLLLLGLAPLGAAWAWGRVACEGNCGHTRGSCLPWAHEGPCALQGAPFRVPLSPVAPPASCMMGLPQLDKKALHLFLVDSGDPILTPAFQRPCLFPPAQPLNRCSQRTSILFLAESGAPHAQLKSCAVCRDPSFL